MANRVVRHTAYNTVGLVAPIGAALVSIPLLVSSLGADRFGILTLVWAIVNYFGIFDLGLGRALTLQLALIFSEGRGDQANELIRTSLAALLLLGFVAGGALLICTPLVLTQFSANLDPDEMSGTVAAMAAALPFIVVTSGLRGALEAKSAFGVLNAIRIPMSLLNFALPVVIAIYGSGRLDDIAWGLALARAIGMFAHVYFLPPLFPGVFSSLKMRKAWLRTLFSNGGWMTVSNIVSPLMGYLDRFIVGLVLSAALVAYYATPQELILKVYIIPGALTAVLFPAFAGNRDGSYGLYSKSLLGVLAIVAPACIIGFTFAHWLLSLWINEAFANQSYRAMQILIVGVFCGAMSSIPYTYLQATGRANLTAVSHVIQLPLFLTCSYLFTARWGIEGAAAAWSIRLAADAAVLFAAAQFLQPKEKAA